MADGVSYESDHPIDPSQFDLTVIGTGLLESIITAATSAVGKTVLHLDPNSLYGGHFSSFSLNEFASFFEHEMGNKEDLNTESASPSFGDGGTDYMEVDLKSQCLYSDIEISSQDSSGDLGKFYLDISGPRLLFCADSAVNLILKSGAKHHVQFMSIDATFIYGDDGKLSSVPDSRSAIFKDKSLGLVEKNQLMRFFKLVQEHVGNTETTQEQHGILSEDLESPFTDFLTKQQLSPKIKSIILYAIAMADYDQERPEDFTDLVTTKKGIESLALYHSSVGRFKDAGALLYPRYGQGELSPAFCRAAAVKGALQVFRIPLRCLLFDKESRAYKGLRLASGQEIFSNQLVIGPSFIDPSQLLPEMPQKISDGSIVTNNVRIARAVCIMTGSVMPGLSNLLVIFPPRSLYPKQVTSIRLLQLGGNVAVSPSNLYILYLSMLCNDAAQGKESLHTAINAICRCSTSGSGEKCGLVQIESVKEATPTLLWSAMYIQNVTKVSSDACSLCPLPDGNLDYRDILESTEKLFKKLYPNEEYFPETNDAEDMDNEEAEAE